MATVSSLIDTLNTGTDSDRVQAAHALGDLGDSRAFEPLVHLLRTTEVPQVRDAAAVGLGALGDRRAVPALRDQLWRPENEHNRGTIVYALGQLKAAEAVIDYARLLCEAVFEPAYMALLAIEEFDRPIDPETRARVLALIERRWQQPMDNDWRGDLLDEAEEVLRAEHDVRDTGGT